jgi:hypothetical protein
MSPHDAADRPDGGAAVRRSLQLMWGGAPEPTSSTMRSTSSDLPGT